MSNIAAILLAAGRSERMGAFKPLLPFGNQTVVEACVENLKDGGVGSIIVVLGHRAADVKRQLERVDVTFAENTLEKSEMGVSLVHGFEKVQDNADAVFVALVDQPAIPAGVIRFMIEERERTGARLLVPTHEGKRGHPVLIDLGFRESLLNLDPERGLRAFFEEHKDEILAIPVSSPFIARDMDSWDDYRALYRDIFQSEPPITRQSLAP